MALDILLIDPEVRCNPDGVFEQFKILYDTNITHNLREMAMEANIYTALWKPYKLAADGGNPHARDITETLEKGLADLTARPQFFEQFNSSSGWGTYIDLVAFLANYLKALKRYPNALVAQHS